MQHIQRCNKMWTFFFFLLHLINVFKTFTVFGKKSREHQKLYASWKEKLRSEWCWKETKRKMVHFESVIRNKCSAAKNGMQSSKGKLRENLCNIILLPGKHLKEIAATTTRENWKENKKATNNSAVILAGLACCVAFSYTNAFLVWIN